MNRLLTQEGMTVREQAAWWLAELQAAPSPAAEARFAAWLKESPRHVEEFLLFNALWKKLDGADVDRAVDLDGLIAKAKTALSADKVVPLEREDAAVPEKRRQPRYARLAAAVAIISIAAPLLWLTHQALSDGKETFSTALGEQRAVKLADGSFAHLNTKSRIEVEYTEHGRDIRLMEGEALFSVHRDVSRPFRVQSGAAVVQALGTEFNVYRRSDATTVSVVEGAVQIFERASAGVALPERTTSAAGEQAGAQGIGLRVQAGEQADVTPAGPAVKHRVADIDKAIAWRSRRLIFRSEPLSAVAAEFNRYNDLKIEVHGSRASARRLIGTFDSDDPESLVQFLAQEGDLAVQRSDHVISIGSR